MEYFFAERREANVYGIGEVINKFYLYWILLFCLDGLKFFTTILRSSRDT
jgi:hypothetical protein